MAFWTARILFAATAVLLLSTDDSLAQLKGNICEMDEAKITELLDCTLSKSPKGTLELWENAKAMFGGKPPAQAVLSLCGASPAAGDTLSIRWNATAALTQHYLGGVAWSLVSLRSGRTAASVQKRVTFEGSAVAKRRSWCRF
ncbi:hypothetical protein HPB49_018976 [Dermacentor silvarum]|uniref:Uncharacterized protein n=1 Tax=Dermacentor silvarum TaxID=543639 RepID=A0ACB8E2I9_DERSI|nr:hypothetical protein HPB49_018976 [Dermacentor silvarum]